MNNDIEFFTQSFEKLTCNAPFPWQIALFQRFIGNDIPQSCNLPTGLGKTSVVAIWLIALAYRAELIPRRLVYVVNRRTVVDQTTDEVEKYQNALLSEPLRDIREQLATLCAVALQSNDSELVSPLAVSTLRGQFADNREWSVDPSRPAVIVGTVDMIGSRLLFSGYGVGFKAKPLHAGFLGQDVLLVHDEAHLEPAFQELLTSIEAEQKKCREFRIFRVMELTATSRENGKPFTLGADDLTNETVKKRIMAKKTIHLHEVDNEKNIADRIADLALRFKDSKRSILVFVRKVEDVLKISSKLAREELEVLTGTLRGKERDGLVERPIFKRFLPNAMSGEEVAYLLCTSAGEVGVNISADHLICDLSTFECMAQRFGRVNRFGECEGTEIRIVHPTEFAEHDDYDSRRKKTLDLIKQLKSDGSPNALSSLDASKRAEAFAPKPIILPATDILFDAWALTTIRGKLPGRPPVEPYLHGLPTAWQPPETHVAWRDEVSKVHKDFETVQEKKEFEEYAAELLDDYPLKAHELLTDNSVRVFDSLKKLKVPADTPVWIQSEDESVRVTTLGAIVEAGKDELDNTTVILPVEAGGLSEQGILDATSETASDVADEWFLGNERTHQRIRVWSDEGGNAKKPDAMRLIRRIDIKPTEDDDGACQYWYWFEIANEGEESCRKPVLWRVHVDDVVGNARLITSALNLSDELKEAVDIAAQFHDHGKCRRQFQYFLGNFGYPQASPIAKSGKKGGRLAETYRHEFGSLIDVQKEEAFNRLPDEMKHLVLHVIAVHHGRARPNFPPEEAFDPERPQPEADDMASVVPRRFARLQRKYGRWGLAYLESLLRAADWAASANPSKFVEDEQ